MSHFPAKMVMVLILICLTTFVSVNGQCTQESPWRCVSSQGVLDLSPISRFEDQSDTGGAWLYSYSPATSFTEGSGECTNVAVCQINSDQSESYPCGTLNSATFGQDTTSGNTVVTYSSTDSTGTARTTIVLLQCDESVGADTLTAQGEDPNTPATYLMTLKSPHCCFKSDITTESPNPTPPATLPSCTIRNQCSTCGRPIDVTITLNNQFKSPYFKTKVTLKSTPQRELVYLMQEAADIDPSFNFVTSYRHLQGFNFTSINGETADINAKSFWGIYVENVTDSGPVCEGVTYYIPDHMESVVFNLTNESKDLPQC